MTKQKVRIFDSAFTPFSKSASLREENKDVHPTHFEWIDVRLRPNMSTPIFYTDGALFFSRAVHHNDVLWLIEPRHLRPENYKEALHQKDLFKYILTYDKELLDKCDNALFYPLGGSSIAFDKWGMYEKTKDICMFVSNRKQTEGHKLRHKIAEEFGDRIDLYGAGVGKPVDSKFEVLKDYRFCVVVESGFAPFYFSEKLIDPISVGCMPIYVNLSENLCPDIDFKDGLGVTCVDNISDIDVICRRIEYFVEGVNPFGLPIFYPTQNYILKYIEEAKKYAICENYIWEHYPQLFGRDND